MSRRAARGLHLGLILVGVLLYFFFVLPRWWVLTGDIPSGLATAGRIAAGIPIAAGAYPVLTILRQSLGRKLKTPELALRLRAWSAVLHVVAGGLILLAAIAEIWLGLGTAGPYLFAVYGTAASIAILGVLALYLSFVAEKPPAPPKPPVAAKPAKAKAPKKPRGKKRDSTTAAVEAEPVSETFTEDADGNEIVETTTATVAEAVENETAEASAEPHENPAEPETGPEPVSPGLRNKRPTGKIRLRR